MTAAVARRKSTTVAPSHRNRSSRTRPPTTDRVSSPGRRSASSRSALKLVDRSRFRIRSFTKVAVIAIGTLIVGGLFAIAFFQATLAANQKNLDTMRAEIAAARKEKATLAQAVDEASSPIAIVTRAEELGMVRAIQPVYLSAVAPAPVRPTERLELPTSDDLLATGELAVGDHPIGSESSAADRPQETPSDGEGSVGDPASSNSPLAGTTAVSSGTVGE